MNVKKKYECEYVGSFMKVILLGEIDHHSAVEIRNDIDREIIERRPKRLFFDLSKVDFMDSSGLGLIMGRYSVITELSGEMVVINPSPQIKKILSLAGIERLIRIEEKSTENETEPPLMESCEKPSERRKRIRKRSVKVK